MNRVDILTAIAREYFIVEEVNATVDYNPNTKQHRVQTLVSFRMPTDDGGYYWEEEIASTMYYDWQTIEDVLLWIKSQWKASHRGD